MFDIKVSDDLTLKRIEKEDASDLFSVIDNARNELRTFLPWVDGTEEQADTEVFIEQALDGYEKQTSLTAVLVSHGQKIGLVSFNLIDQANKSVHIGYWLSPIYQGKGLMTQAVKAMIDYAFAELDTRRIDIRAATENVKSRAIPERLTFVHEGRLREAEQVNGQFFDQEVYSMLVSEWTKQNQ
ncbi:GNAT family N-acetyltransferase [Salsuginibacillus kocurii]|uniref:GNAT family N-acetyltransferase n=1 Tax=Salsuginibacillus kocurii TaxID=427078 RepID=UPI00036AE847|nr:GNAT family protein [Salsuginibacillus kocurii]